MQAAIQKDQISEALGLLLALRSLEKSQASLRMPPLRLCDDAFQSFAVLECRIRGWLKELRFAMPNAEQASHTPDFEGLTTGPVHKDIGPSIEAPL